MANPRVCSKTASELQEFSRYSFLFVIAAFALGFGQMSFGQSFPNRLVRVIGPFEAGTPDTLARLVAQQLTAQMGQTFLVENRAGANGMIGADVVAKSRPDGYTLMVTSTALVVNPSVYKSIPYNTAKDFAPITNFASVDGLLLLVNPALPVHSLKELMALGRAGNAYLSYASAGFGNQLHVANELFNVRAGLNMVHVPYKGGGPAITALVGGDVQVMLMSPPPSLQLVKAGKLRALAYTHAKRASFLPEVPTMAEAGIPDLEIDGGWYGMFAPADTPRDLLNRLQSEVRTALNFPKVRDAIIENGLTIVGDSTAAFTSFVDAEMKNYAERVRLTKIQPQ